eukprot:1157312-Pelagomonas_calceolata.AAC.1
MTYISRRDDRRHKTGLPPQPPSTAAYGVAITHAPKVKLALSGLPPPPTAAGRHHGGTHPQKEGGMMAR